MNREQAVRHRNELVAQGLIDSSCRYARWDVEHVCENRDGGMRPWSACWHEAVQQMRETADAERVAQ